MPLIPAPPTAPQRDTIALRIDCDLHAQLREYAEFLHTTKEYIVSSALRRVFRHDKDFLNWQQRRNATEASGTATSSVRTPASAVGAEQASGPSTHADAQRRASSKERA